MSEVALPLPDNGRTVPVKVSFGLKVSSSTQFSFPKKFHCSIYQTAKRKICARLQIYIYLFTFSFVYLDVCGSDQ